MRRLCHQALGEEVECALVDQTRPEEDVLQASEAEGRLAEVGVEEDVVVDERVAEAEGSGRELGGDCWLRFCVVPEGEMDVDRHQSLLLLASHDPVWIIALP